MTPRIKRQKDPRISDWLFQDTEKDRTYGRIVGGVGFPSIKPGAIVVLAQEYCIRPLPTPPVYVLEVIQSEDLDQLISYALDLQRDFLIQDYYGDTGNYSAMEYLSYRNNQASDKRTGVLHLQNAPSLCNKDLSFFQHSIKKSLSKQDKSLYLEGFTELAGTLSEMVEVVPDLTKEPLVFALGSALVELQSNPHTETGNRQQQFAKTEYDLFANRNTNRDRTTDSEFFKNLNHK